MTHNFSCMFISILYMFQASMCPSSGELLYQCDTWFMSLCVDDGLVCRFTCIRDGHLHRVIFLMMCTWVPKTCRELKWTFMKNCESSWLFTRIILGCTVNKTLKKYHYFMFVAYFKYSNIKACQKHRNGVYTLCTWERWNKIHIEWVA